MEHHIKAQTLAEIAGVILSALALSRANFGQPPGDWEEDAAPEIVRLEAESGDDSGEVYLRIGGAEYWMSPRAAREISGGLLRNAESADWEQVKPVGANLRQPQERGEAVP